MRFDSRLAELCWLGPLVRTIKPSSNPNPELTRRIESALVALGRGVRDRDDLLVLSPQTKSDFGQNPVGEVAGVTAVRFLAARDLVLGSVRHHDTPVARVLYLMAVTDHGERPLLISLAADHRLADLDVLSD